jgi:hypothetical protein
MLPLAAVRMRRKNQKASSFGTSLRDRCKEPEPKMTSKAQRQRAAHWRSERDLDQPAEGVGLSETAFAPEAVVV